MTCQNLLVLVVRPGTVQLEKEARREHLAHYPCLPLPLSSQWPRWVWGADLPLTRPRPTTQHLGGLGESLSFSGPSFLHLKSGNSDSAYLPELV